MKWILKAIIQKAISYLPSNEQINYFFQTKISKNFPVSEKEIISGRGSRAVEHLSFIRNHTNLNISNALFFEFGAGLDLPVPLVFYMAGVNRQILIDIEPHVRLSLVNDMIKKLNNCSKKLFSKINSDCRSLGEKQISSLTDLKQNFGIEYIAPLDARKTGFDDCSIDCCTNTFTLEHIPEDDIWKIFKELYRIIKPGGIVSCFADMNDHYAYFDRTITVYNFLKFSKSTWRWINSDVHYQNRLRYADYKKIYIDCGFEIIHEELNLPDEMHLKALKEIKVNKDFSKYTLQELGIRSSKTLLKKSKTIR